ncbi:MAG: tRNA (adenosine(37)-N6)-dimethylallyltransferase MiaA [Candidatus Magasanikbacteria bacterium RIFOXYC2_FULL_39_8]|nr:MAG: tRNA (adenosine(37)-N6)-dimethylallyltransferase MiaA [Candidatus Magasanikbacteria bacterium RIFOXYC2_FULL_39_8]
MADEHTNLPKVVVLLGPTTCGKTQWSLDLARAHKGEIISADSRQIYKKMTIGTAKVVGEWRREGLSKTYYVGDTPHYLVDFLDPGKMFTVADFHDRAVKQIRTIVKGSAVPFVVGGTGLYIHAIVDNLEIPRVAPNKKLRKSFEEKTEDELIEWLQKLDPKTAESVDQHNKRRIIRALEVCILSGEPFSAQQTKGDPLFNVFQIGIKISREELYDRIEKRVDAMIKDGLVEEVRNLLRQKYSWDLPSMSGIGYRQFKGYFDGEYSLDEAIERLKRDTRHYSKRQFTWFRRDPRIKWCETYDEAQQLVSSFLNV